MKISVNKKIKINSVQKKLKIHDLYSKIRKHFKYLATINSFFKQSLIIPDLIPILFKTMKCYLCTLN